MIESLVKKLKDNGSSLTGLEKPIKELEKSNGIGIDEDHDSYNLDKRLRKNKNMAKRNS